MGLSSLHKSLSQSTRRTNAEEFPDDIVQFFFALLIFPPSQLSQKFRALISFPRKCMLLSPNTRPLAGERIDADTKPEANFVFCFAFPFIHT